MTAEDLRGWLRNAVARAARLDESEIGVDEPFDSFGLSSREGVELSGELEVLLGRELPPTLVYEFPTIAQLARYLVEPHSEPSRRSANETHASGATAIAIVGMSCRFPGASGLDAFWDLLVDGRESISEVPVDRWRIDDFYDADPLAPGKTLNRHGGFLDRIDGFDAGFFGVSPGEAERMDPQQRLLLELAYEAFEDAGLTRRRLAGSRTSVFTGISINEYAAQRFNDFNQINGHSATGAALSIAANRISYAFDLTGPSMAIDTACSSSLVAVHMACASLLAGECDAALAGGVNLILSPSHAIAFSKAGVIAPDGRCKPFSAAANGYVRGEGGGLVVLKTLERAKADGDFIYAVIRGSAVSQDGRTNGLIAPNREAQEAVLASAYRRAGICPTEVRYIEAHGTGTLLGDSIEARALGAVVGNARDESCRLGSVKGNIGHLEAAAGIAGLIKVSLSLARGLIPPTLHAETVNPQIPFDELGLALVQSAEPWPNGKTALAGVSSFGFGGTNAHVVLEQQPAAATGQARGDTFRILPLSAHDQRPLRELAQRYCATLDASDAPSIADLTFTNARRRNHLPYRTAVVVRTKAELREELARVASDEPSLGAVPPARASNPSQPILLFSGHGGQWSGMGRELLKSEPVYRTAFENCCAALEPHLDSGKFAKLIGGDISVASLDIVQPAIFAVQVSLAALWQDWGVKPEIVLGHSMGEVAAAHVAGVIYLEQAARLTCVRSGFLARLAGHGGMASIGLGGSETARLLAELDSGLTIAARNGPNSTVVAGGAAALSALLAEAERREIYCAKVDVDVPAHSPAVGELADEMGAAIGVVAPRTTETRFVSSVEGYAGTFPLMDGEYWTQNLVRPVNFVDAISGLIREGCTSFVEIGPHPILRHAVEQVALELGSDVQVIGSLQRDAHDQRAMLLSLGRLYVGGYDPAWGHVVAEGAPVSVPPYPWQHTRYWIDAGSRRSHSGSRDGHPLLGDPIDLANAGKERIWDHTIDVRTMPWLKDHRVNDAVWIPAAAILEACLAAGGYGTVSVNELNLFAPLVLEEESKLKVQSTLSDREGGEMAFALYSRNGEESPWVRNASATLSVRSPDDNAHQNSEPLDCIMPRLKPGLEPEAFYERLASHGLSYGPAFRRISGIWTGSSEALVRIVPKAEGGMRTDQYQIHPCLVDAALQAVAAAMLEEFPHDSSLIVPSGCRQAWISGPADGELWGHAVIRGIGARMEADVNILDGNGRIIAVLAGCRFARQARPTAGDLQAFPDVFLYQQHWRTAPEPACDLGVQQRSGSDWIVVSDQSAMAEALSRQLGVCTVLPPPRDGGDTAWSEQLPRGSRLQGIVFVADEIDNPEGSVGECGRALALARSLVATGPALGYPRLWIATCGAQPVIAGDPASPHQAALWGLGKTIAFELPELGCSLFDCDPRQEVEANAAALSREVCAGSAENQMAFRKEERFVARLAPYETSSSSITAAIRPDRTYLITGGLGGLGLGIAQWLIDAGAMHLLLLGRSGPSPSAIDNIEAMRSRGAQIRVEQVDVAEFAALEKILTEVQATGPALAGVFHAAGLLDNAPIGSLDDDRLARVMAPKVAGAWNLHLATKGLRLDCFVLFSSAVSVLGSPGQGNYSAGNAFMDALAHCRLGSGLSALSINWGPWAEVGLVADDNGLGSGIKGIQPRVGLEAMGHLMKQHVAQVVALPFELSSLLGLYPAAAKIPFFSEVGGGTSHVAKLYARPPLSVAYLAPRNEIEERIADQWRQTLRIDQVGVRDSFFELGGDSVLASQIITSIERGFGLQIDLQHAFQAFTVEELALQIELAMVEQIEAMSDAEAERLLGS